MPVDSWLLSKLACPFDQSPLDSQGGNLTCASGHSFPVVDDIPILLRDDAAKTHPAIEKTLTDVKEKRVEALRIDSQGDAVDPVVQQVVSATCGRLYAPLVGRLTRYPIPQLRLPSGEGRTLLDVGCNWGRWTFAAARKGYRAVGIDPDLGPLLAAKRIAAQLGLSASFVVGDARKLPFRTESFETIFSYSVIQHFSHRDARAALAECGRVLARAGTAMIQMPNKYGGRNFVHQITHRRPQQFDVRYWSPQRLRLAFEDVIGPVTISVDGFFGLGIQPDDVDLLPYRYRLVVKSSELLRKASLRFPLLCGIADSLYVTATKSAH